MPTVDGAQLWLDIGPEPVYGVLHSPSANARRELAVLFLPPFGWQQICSYRARRRWAVALAQAGFTALRIDLPGTEDSVGVAGAEGRFDSWLCAASEAAAWLRATAQARRVVTVGIGVGGLVALSSCSAGAPIDDLILWGVPATGRACVRELRNHAKVVEARFPDEEPESIFADGTRCFAGYFMSAETHAALERLDLTALPLHDAHRRRALLIERDGRGFDARLREHLERLGVQVQLAPASDYAALMAHPQFGQIPSESIARSIEWLDALAGEPDGGERDRDQRHGGAALDSVTFEYDGRDITESLFICESSGGRLFGVVSEPAERSRSELCVVGTNAGAIRRTGPNRMWAELARRCAARGVRAVRFDHEGLGDSDGADDLYVETAAIHAPRMDLLLRELLDHLVEDGVADRFMTVGLCSGAHMALQAAVADDRVVGAALSNLYAFQWTEALEYERNERETAGRARRRIIARIRRRGISVTDVRRAVRAYRTTIASRVSGGEEGRQARLIRGALTRLCDRRKHVLFLFSRGEPLYAQFERQGFLAGLREWPGIEVVQLSTRDHEMRRPSIQAAVLAHIDGAVSECAGALASDDDPSVAETPRT